MRRISISDVTMKASEQSRKFTLSFKEKIELAKLLDKLGADVIEIGAIKNKKIDSLLVKSVAAAVKKAGVALSVGRTKLWLMRCSLERTPRTRSPKR